MPHFKIITIQELSQILEPACTDSHNATQEAWWLLEALTGKDQAHLIQKNEITLTLEQHQKLEQWLLERTRENKPLQYILGTVDFCGLKINVRPPILIPRPETEYWVDWLSQLLKNRAGASLSILDLCSGSGCIALALAHTLPNSTVLGLDINEQAIKLACENTQNLRITNATFKHSDLFSALNNSTQFDLIVSNPPYIEKSEWNSLENEVKLWEDPKALIAPDEGLYFYKQIISAARNYLKAGERAFPCLVFEIGALQGQAVSALLAHAHFSNITIHKDLAGRDRFVSAYY
jgi:release factor glutamine methyltransferase